MEKIYKIINKIYPILAVLILLSLIALDLFVVDYYNCKGGEYNPYYYDCCEYSVCGLSNIFSTIHNILFIILWFIVLLSPIVFILSIKSLKKEIKNLSYKKIFFNLTFYNLLISGICIFYMLFVLFIIYMFNL